MLLSWTNCTRRAWRFTPPFTIDRWNPSEENNSEGCARTWPRKELVSKPGWLIRARSQARQFRRLNWTRKLKARIGPRSEERRVGKARRSQGCGCRGTDTIG